MAKYSKLANITTIKKRMRFCDTTCVCMILTSLLIICRNFSPVVLVTRYGI